MQQHLANMLWVVSQPQLLELASCSQQGSAATELNPSESLIPNADWLLRWQRETTELRQSLASCDPKTTAIDAKESNFPRLLGHCYENYWHQIIARLPAWSLALNNLQIIDNKRTLGEIDAIILDKNNKQYEHWEFSCKFYMLIGDDEVNPNHWVGPNHTDSLGRKLKRLFEHQLPLIELPVVKNALTLRQLDVVRQRVMLHGRLFTPFEIKETAKLSIDVDMLTSSREHDAPVKGADCTEYTQTQTMHVSPANIGQWCLIEQLPSIRDSLDGDDWVLLEKLHWMNYQVVQDTSMRYTTLDLQTAISKQNRPTMVRHCKTGRCLFVVTEPWLLAARESIKLLNK
jgi:hypothetical protein